VMKAPAVIPIHVWLDFSNCLFEIGTRLSI
jgi:hypothetical protein